MEITNAKFEAGMPCIESNIEDQKDYWSSDFEIDFEDLNFNTGDNVNFRLKGTVNCEIIDDTDVSGEDDRTNYYLGNFTFNFLRQVVIDDFIIASIKEVELMKIKIENYINNKFE